VRTDRYSDLTDTNRVGWTTNCYSLTGLVTNITHLGAADEVLARYDYVRDAVHQIRQWTINDYPSTFDYDLTGQLTNALRVDLPHESYEYDANGNRNGAAYIVDVNNQILTDGTFMYTFNASLVCDVELLVVPNGTNGISVIICVHVNCQVDLPSIADTSGSPGSALGTTEDRQKQGCQNRNESDHHQQFDQCEPALHNVRSACERPYYPHTVMSSPQNIPGEPNGSGLRGYGSR
jgi:hypothetical protein